MTKIAGPRPTSLVKGAGAPERHVVVTMLHNWHEQRVNHSARGGEAAAPEETSLLLFGGTAGRSDLDEVLIVT